MGQIFSNVIENCSCGSSSNDYSEEIQEMKTDIKIMKENHLHHIESDVNELKTDMKILNNEIGDIKLLLSKLT